MAKAPLATLVLAAALLGATALFAQVPPHVPGEICFTDRGWCWVQPAGRPGDACVCVGADGANINGTLN